MNRIRAKLVPATALVLSVCAIVVIATLNRQAAASRNAHLTISNSMTVLETLQIIPWVVGQNTSGPASSDLATMRTLERKIDSSIARLVRDGAPENLRAVRDVLRSNYTNLARIYWSGVHYNGWPNPALSARLELVADAPHQRAVAILEKAGVTYERRATQADRRSLFGTLAAILGLLAAFGWYFGRSVRARARAETLGEANERLLETSREEAATDALTKLANRRALMNDIESALSEATPDQRYLLALFDLDGFKQYNDSFGHSAGDALLSRLGAALASTVAGVGAAYRIGGDEFVILARLDTGGDEIVRLAAAALHEAGDRFDIGCSYGFVHLPTEASSLATALHLADQRMYEQKASSRSSTIQQVVDVLVKVLSEHATGMTEHVSSVAAHAQQLSVLLGLQEAEVKRIVVAARLHDVGKSAIPHTILNKPHGLDKDEWEFIRRHTLIGERIMLAAPSLAPVAGLVRASHERWDGGGYPDGLAAEQIPLGSRIIAVCDAFDAMVSDRPYRKATTDSAALAELRECAGTQFDPDVVRAFCAMVKQTQPGTSSIPASVCAAPGVAALRP